MHASRTDASSAFASPIEGFDHPVIAVRDMDAARDAFERLGFTVPPRGTHAEWGTGNWCIMFEHDYLELRGIVDPARYTHELDRFLARREGLIGVAFSASASAREVVAKLEAQGLHPAPPRELTRNFDLPSGRVQPRFRLIFFDATETDGLMASLICQHLTPGLIRQPSFLQHPNGATRVVAMTAVVADLDRAADLARRYFGADRVSRTAAGIDAAVGRGAHLHLVDPPTASARGVALPSVGPPYLSEITLGTASLAQARDALARGGIAFDGSDAARLRIVPDQCCGIWLAFVDERRDP